MSVFLVFFWHFFCPNVFGFFFLRVWEKGGGWGGGWEGHPKKKGGGGGGGGGGGEGPKYVHPLDLKSGISLR